VLRAIWKALGRNHMDVSLRLGSDLDVRIIERPGLWMSPKELDALTAVLRGIAAKTLDAGSLTYGVFSGDKTRIESTIITLVSRRDGAPIAFNALAVMEVDTTLRPTEVLHLGLVMIDPNERSKSLSWLLYGLTCFLICLRRQFRPVWVSNVTQVPSVVGMVSEMFSDVYPRPDGGRRSLNHLLLARRIMVGQRCVFGVGDDAHFDEENFVITNAYTGGSDDLKKTWDTAPKHRDARYNDFCAARLDYVRGDDVIQIGRMDMAAIRGYLIRDVPRSALLGLLLMGMFVTVQRLILPAIYWADSSKPWATLRPAKKGRG
jgi:hypothetical protein